LDRSGQTGSGRGTALTLPGVSSHAPGFDHGEAVSWSPVPTSVLRDWLESQLRERLGATRTVIRLARRPFAYSTSFTQEELQVDMDDGTALHLVFKDLRRHALRENARSAKPLFLYEPRREIEVYRTILQPYRVGGPVCYATAIDPDTDRYWLAVEFVPGWTLFEVEETLWPLAAGWLAAMHVRFAGRQLDDLATRAHLLRYDRDYYVQWASRVSEFVPWELLEAGDARRLQSILNGYGDVAHRLASLPPTFLHGEFFASNVVIETLETGHRVCPVDWEMAAIGPGLIDLAALTSGEWTASQRETLARAYWDALPREARTDFDGFLLDLRYCHLHIALQWLGWAPDWTPPPEHATNWLREVLAAAADVGVAR
jgi:hypothetical protein